MTATHFSFFRSFSTSEKFSGWAACVVLLLFTLGTSVPSAAHATIYVTTATDKIDQTPGCSLKEAIWAANLQSAMAINGLNGDGSDHIFTTNCMITGDFTDGISTIELPPGMVFYMNQIANDRFNAHGPTATPMIFATVRIEGNGAQLLWTGSPNVNARAFTLGKASIVNAAGLTITGSGNVIIYNLRVTNFVAQGGNGATGGGGGAGLGGAIFVAEGTTLDIESCTFDGNVAIGGNGSHYSTEFSGGGGGGIGGNGGAGISDGSGGGGGGSRGFGASVPGSGNELFVAGGGGGGTLTPGTTNVGGINCGADPGADDGSNGKCPGGGGSGGAPVASDTCVPLLLGHAGNGGSGNYGGGGGGGGSCRSVSGGDGGNGGFGGGGGASGGDGVVTDSQGGNGGFGGGAGVSTDDQGNKGHFGGSASNHNSGGGAGLGGAIFNETAALTVNNSTFTANRSVGGRKGSDSDTEAGTGEGHGGAIFSMNGSTSLLNSTIANNYSSGKSGGVYLYKTSGTVLFYSTDTIFAGDTEGDCVFDGTPTTVFMRGNLIESNDSSHPCQESGGIGVVSNSDPQLGPLQNNQGPTPTMAIPMTSPAFNTADAGTSANVDQRGQQRPAQNGFDIGAFELCLEPDNSMCPIPPPFSQSTTLTMQVSPSGAGTTTPAVGMYNEPLNSVVPITATAASGFTFTGWSSNVANPSAASTMVVMTGAQVVTADFTGCQCAKNISSSVTVTLGGFTYNMMTGLYSQTVTITNNTTSAFSGPISLVLDSLSTNATLSNATGTTDSLEPPAGSPYINFAGNLGSGMITLTLQFSDPTHALPITYTSRVLAGTGSR